MLSIIVPALVACRGATEPRIMHWYDRTPYTTSVYEDAGWYYAPDAK